MALAVVSGGQGGDKLSAYEGLRRWLVWSILVVVLAVTLLLTLLGLYQVGVLR